MKRQRGPKANRCIGKNKAGKRCSKRIKNGKRCAQHPPQKNGRPLIVWDKKEWEKFDLFCAAHDSQKDIGQAMGLDLKTIDSICKRERELSFSEYSLMKRGWGRAIVAGKILEVAIKGSGNVALLKLLGQQWLGHKDKAELSAPGGGPIAIAIDARLKGMTDEQLKALDEKFESEIDEATKQNGEP